VAAPYAPPRPRGRSLARRPPASSYPHIAAADRHLPAAVAAVAGVLAGIKINTQAIRQWAGAVSPELVGQLAGPVAKRDPLSDVLAAAAGDAASVSITGQFGLANPDAVTWAQARSGELIAGIDDETRRLIADQVARGQAGDLSAQQIAAKVRDLVGLTPQQARAMQAFRGHLERVADAGKAGKPAAATVANTFGLSPWKGGKLDAAKVDKLVDQYRGRLVKQRAETIARTEMIRAANEGDRLAWQKQIDQGGADGMIVVREWSVTHDDRLCPVCRKLDGDKVESAPNLPGARIKIDALLFAGGLAGPPVHPRCRCTILTTLELAEGLAPIPVEPPAPEPEPPEVEEPPAPERTWQDDIADRKAAVEALMAKGRGKGGNVPAPALRKAERELREAGKVLDAEIDRRVVAEGVKPISVKERTAIEKMRLRERELRDKYFDAADDRSTRTPMQKHRARIAWEAARSEYTRSRSRLVDYDAARRRHLPGALRDVRPMGGRFDIAGHAHPGALDFDAKMADVAGRFPAEWVDASNRRGRVRVENADDDYRTPGRAYYSDSQRLVSLTPRQVSDKDNSTAAHEFMHRMEYTRPDIKAAEWAFWSRRAGKETPRSLAAITGNPAYSDHEIAVEDKFGNPYMGKTYAARGNPEDQAWELMTMGVESVYYGSHVIDDEYRAFVLGVLTTL
jgi:hypothetical protein